MLLLVAFVALRKDQHMRISMLQLAQVLHGGLEVLAQQEKQVWMAPHSAVLYLLCLHLPVLALRW